MNSTPYPEYLDPCCTIARQAGAVLMRYFRSDFATQHKEDKSPVTDADVAANVFIREALLKLAPEVPVVAEEDETLTRDGQSMFWLVDPLDGTRSFVRGEKEFTVNIGLVKDRRPVLGALYAPPQDILYFAVKGKGAFRSIGGGTAERITTRAPESKLIVTRSRSHPSALADAYLKNLDIGETIPMSSAAKFGLIAEGRADIYPRFGRTMEWDTAAGHVIIEEAGGRLETVDGKPFFYGKPGFANPPFIAYGR